METNLKLKSMISLCSVLIISACGGGGGNSVPSSTVASSIQSVISSSSSSSQSSAPIAKKGKFIDSPVAGLDYQTSTRKGKTDANGEFEYDVDGESIAFSIGSVELGNTYTSTQVHVFSLQQTKTDESNEKGVRVAQLLQSIDSDSDAKNGINITQNARDSVLKAGIDFNLTVSDWDQALTTVVTGLNKPAVSLSDAYEHAKSYQEAGACIILPKIYKGDLGEFNSQQLSCFQRARAEAFFEDVRPDFITFESEMLNDPMINNGEEIINANIKKAMRENFAKLYFDAAMDGYKTIKSYMKDDAVTLKVFSNAAAFNKDIFLIASLNSTGTEAQHWTFTSNLFDFLSSTSACIDGDYLKCAKATEQFLKSSGIAQKLLGKEFSLDDISKLMKLLEAWLKVEKDLRGAISKADWSLAIKAGGNSVEALTKTVTGAYLRTDSQTAHRGNWTNAFEVASEGFNTWAQCVASLVNKEQTGGCLASFFNYYNARMAEVFNYTGAFIAVGSIRYEASRVQVARLVLEELYRYGDIRELFAAYGISYVPGDWLAGNKELKALELVFAVANKANAWPTGNPILLTRDFRQDVLDEVRLNQNLVNLKAEKYMKGEYVDCSSVRISGISLTPPGGVLAVGEELAVKVNSTVGTINSFDYDWGDGVSVNSSLSTASHKFSKSGIYKVSVYPVRKNGNDVKRCSRISFDLNVLERSGAIDLPANVFVNGVKVALSANGYGADTLMNAPPYTAADNAAEWDFNVATAGKYELFATYASGESRPVSISFNGKLAFSNALSAATGGFYPANRQTLSQGVVQLPAGKNVMRVFEVGINVFPHIKGFSLVSADCVSSQSGTAGGDGGDVIFVPGETEVNVISGTGGDLTGGIITREVDVNEIGITEITGSNVHTVGDNGTPAPPSCVQPL